MYIIALSMIAIVTVFSQVLIQDYLSNQVKDSRLINISSRLRTYSQSLSKTALLIERGKDVKNDSKEFLNTFKQLQKSHNGLVSGSEFFDLPRNDREDLEQMYKIIEGPFEKISRASDSLIYHLEQKPYNQANISKFVNIILSYEKSYLLGMELVVFDYDRFSRNSVMKLKDMEFYLSAFVIVMLLMEVVFIFYPLSKRIRRIIHNLSESQEEHQVLAEEVKASNATLEKSLRELRELTYAIEKANYLVKTDEHGNIIYANDKYSNVSKYPNSDLIGKPLFYNNMGGEESKIYLHIRDNIRKREVWQGEIYDHASDGTGFWLDVTLMPVFDEKGNIYQYLVICTDITKRKNTERKLRLLMEEKLQNQQDEQKIKSYSMIMGQEKERKRVAAEIHDGIGQMLTSTRMRIEMVESKYPELASDINEIQVLLQSIIIETRRICSDLLPNVLDDFGLKAAINEVVKSIGYNAEIKVLLEEQIQSSYLEREVEISVYRIFQEAINNILKHAKATEINIFIDNNSNRLNLMIQDNGQGFDFDENMLFVKEYVKSNSGLRNMKERAELLGGELTINSVKNLGTTIQLEIPL